PGGKKSHDHDRIGFVAESVEPQAVCNLYGKRDAAVQRHGQGDRDLLRWHNGAEDCVPERRKGKVHNLDAGLGRAQHHGDVQRQRELSRKFGFVDADGELGIGHPSGAKGPFKTIAVTAALKRCATQNSEVASILWSRQNLMRLAALKSHPCAKNAQGWGTRSSRPNPRGGSNWGAALASCLTLFAGHGIERGYLLLHVLAAALGAFHLYLVFFQGEDHFEGFVTIVADVVVHGHGDLPLDRDHELRLELYADGWRFCGKAS